METVLIGAITLLILTLLILAATFGIVVIALDLLEEYKQTKKKNNI